LLNWNPGSQERLDFTKLFARRLKIFRTRVRLAAVYGEVGKKLTPTPQSGGRAVASNGKPGTKLDPEHCERSDKQPSAATNGNVTTTSRLIGSLV
jgi:hypothetical protein